ncbi:MAG: hypothetical protein OXG35_13470 [Acidobacteria bacterium]|nr:hypothetical protein [Acidobacteriota bacterium]
MITGTLEMVEARADISNVRRDADGTLRYDHDGETTIFYDSMETQKDPAGENLFLDTAGDAVPEHQVALLTPEKAAELRSRTEMMRDLTAIRRVRSMIQRSGIAGKTTKAAVDYLESYDDAIGRQLQELSDNTPSG